MHLTHLTLANFRNYTHLDLDLDPGVTLLQGNNACGKTSLLEAIFYLATSKSPHAGADRELMRWGGDEPIPFARIESQVVKSSGAPTQIEIVLVQATDEKKENANKPNGRISKRIKVNGIPKRGLDLLGELNVVLFLPEDLNLVFGSPGDRRRYLDITLSQIDSRYGRALTKYNQVLEQRNGVLREFKERAYNPQQLDVYTQQLIAEGAYVTARRAEAITHYNQLVAEIQPRLTDAREQLRLVYQPSIVADGEPDIAASFKRQLTDLRARELSAAVTLVGPHRDDVRFWLDRPNAPAMDANTYASRGQGRTIALALKLAEVALMRAETGEAPVLLLDDVMSELDAPRRAAIAQTMMHAPQAIITTTDLEHFTPEFLERVRVLRVCDGAISQERA
jgi:DNA replication and repair protein RecF